MRICLVHDHARITSCATLLAVALATFCARFRSSPCVPRAGRRGVGVNGHTNICIHHTYVYVTVYIIYIYIVCVCVCVCVYPCAWHIHVYIIYVYIWTYICTVDARVVHGAGKRCTCRRASETFIRWHGRMLLLRRHGRMLILLTTHVTTKKACYYF